MTPRGTPLSTLLEGAEIHPQDPPGADPMIGGVTLDSRRVRQGDLFFALPGFKVDGNRFAADAVGHGASAVLTADPRPDWAGDDVAWIRVEEPRRAAGLLSRECHSRPDESLTLVGITGTNGKTTVAYLVESIAKAAGRRAGRLGTVGAAFDDLHETMSHTTPEAPEFYRLLAEMRDRDVEIVAVEVSSHALSLSRVEGARFEVAAFLNLSRDHLDFHRDVESYFMAKSRLFENLEENQSAILADDDPFAVRLAEMTRAQVRTFGTGVNADVRLEQIRCGIDGSSAVLQTPSGPLPIRTRLTGRFNLENVAAAAACALELGLPIDAVTSGVLALENVPGRMERVDRGQTFTVVVDFAHTEDALRNLLTALRPLTSGRLLVVFGCGGDRDAGKRTPMGQAAAQLADLVFVTSDNPRGESPRSIIESIVEGVRTVPEGERRMRAIVDRSAAIRAALEAAEDGDVVAIAGKGHESTLTRGAVVESFDDREVASEALRSLGYGERHA